MQIVRLNWAGIGICSEDVAIVIDPLMHVNEELFGKSRVPFIPLNHFDNVQSVFITHLHSDHFDPKGIIDTYGQDICVYVPLGALSEARDAGLSNIHEVGLGESVLVGPMQVTSVHASDGLGDPQCSWIITDGSKTVFHGGDTLWHGHWRQIAAKHGPFDAAFLPVNGAILQEPNSPSTIEPITMTPEQATAATILLEAKKLIPIHFDAFHNPPNYYETAQCIDRLRNSAFERQVNLVIYQPGEMVLI